MIEQELEKLLASSGTGMRKNYVEDEDGYNRLILSNVQAMGPGGYRDIYALSEAADTPVTEREVASTMAGFPAGQAAGFVGAPGDIAALFGGLYKAAFPDADQSRLDAFLTTVGDISSKYGSEAALDFVDSMATAAGVPDDVRQSFMRGAEGGSFVGFGKAGEAISKGVGMAAKGVAKGVQTYAAGAPQRIADRTSGATLGMGADPTAMVDEAIVAGQKLLKEGKGPTAESPVAVVPPTETEPGIIAFHGSGADFDQFTLEKIGTGEGNQAYGYGLYFTDSEDIAKFYRDTVSQERNQIMFKGKPLDSVYTADILEKFGDDIPEIVSKAKEMGIPGDDEVLTDRVESILSQISQGLSSKRDAREAVKSIRSGSNIVGSPELTIYHHFIEPDVSLPDIPEGKMYKVGLAPKPEDMIDYQATFADQPQKVQDALKAIGYDTSRKFNVEETGNGRYSVISVDDKGQEARKDFAAEVAGKSAKQQAEEYAKKQTELAMRRPMPMVLDSLKGKIIGDVREGVQAPDRPDKILSELLLEQGVPGIKYRAAGSRAANIDAADAEMNYVIFDDKAIKILEKYGIVGPVAVTAIAGAQQQEGDDNGA